MYQCILNVPSILMIIFDDYSDNNLLNILLYRAEEFTSRMNKEIICKQCVWCKSCCLVLVSSYVNVSYFFIFYSSLTNENCSLYYDRKKIHKKQKKGQALANFYNIRQHLYSFVKALCKRFYGTYNLSERTLFFADFFIEIR